MGSAQIFISVSDVTSDQQTAGADEARWYQAIRDASDYLQKRIGWFIPVYKARYLRGSNKPELFIPPLLSVTSATNDGNVLTGSDYILSPNGAHWENGPYTSVVVAPDATGLSEWIDEENGVVIAGLWGLYNKSQATGATVASLQSDSATSLAVSDGGKVSPGMVLLIGTEQELVTGWDAVTSNVTLVNGAVSVAVQTITVDDGTLVKKGEIIRVDFEQMKVLDIRSNELSVVRGWNNSRITTHADNAQVDVYRTVTVERGVNGTTAAQHASSTAVSRYVAPDDIQFLTRQIATLMLNKAKGGYQGRTGNAETGTVFYNDAFPRYDIEQVAANYWLPRVVR